MLVGHYAVGFVAKRAEPSLSLGTFVLAAMLPDLLWCLFTLAGLEHVQFAPGRGAANYFIATNIAWSHSLASDILWGALFAGIFLLARRNRRGAWIIFAAVVSHWLLDFVSHRPDMPLVPGIPIHLGLNLWNSLTGTVVLEGGFWITAIVMCFRTSRPQGGLTLSFYCIGIAILTLIWLGNLTGPPPNHPHTAPLISFTLFSGSVAWAYLISALSDGRRLSSAQTGGSSQSC